MKNEQRKVTIRIKTWGDIKSYILPSVITFLFGIFLFLIESYFFALIFLLTGPCMLYCTCLEIYKAIAKDKKRGYYCTVCNNLLRLREISWVSDEGALCDGEDYYCYKCNERRHAEHDQHKNIEEVKEAGTSKATIKELSPLKSVLKYSVIISSLLVILVGIPLVCLDGFVEWQKIRSDEKSPLVWGSVVNRKPIIYKGIIPGAKFSIKVKNSDEIVHAKTQRYLLNKVPDGVNFHYTGEPAKEVYLIDYEENPFWIFIMGLFGTIFITLPLIVLLKKKFWLENKEASIRRK